MNVLQQLCRLHRFPTLPESRSCARWAICFCLACASSGGTSVVCSTTALLRRISGESGEAGYAAPEGHTPVRGYRLPGTVDAVNACQKILPAAGIFSRYRRRTSRVTGSSCPGSWLITLSIVFARFPGPSPRASSADAAATNPTAVCRTVPGSLRG